MDDSFYDSLEEDSFCECFSDLEDPDEDKTKLCEVQAEPNDQDNLSEIIPLYQRETPKTTIKSLKKGGRSKAEMKKTAHKEVPLLKEKKEKRTYLNLFYNKIKYPVIGGGDVARWQSGSETTRAHYDPSSRNSSALSRGRSEEFFEKEYSSDESSFFEKFIAEEELKRKANESKKSNSGTVSNLLSVSEQCLSHTKLNETKQKKGATTKASSVPSSSLFSGMGEVNAKLQSLRKRQYYGKKVSSRNRAIMEEAKLVKNFNTKLKVNH